MVLVHTETRLVRRFHTDHRKWQRPSNGGGAQISEVTLGRVCWDLGHAQEDPWKYHNLHGQKRSSRRGDQNTEDRSRTVHGTRQITKERPETRTKGVKSFNLPYVRYSCVMFLCLCHEFETGIIFCPDWSSAETSLSYLKF